MAPAIGACWRGKGCQQSWSFPVDRQPGLGRENRQYKDIDSAMKDTVLFFSSLCYLLPCMYMRLAGISVRSKDEDELFVSGVRREGVCGYV